MKTQLALLPEKYKSLLKFDPNALRGQANVIGAKCATDVELVILREQKKLAYVLGKEPNVVTLDCTGYTDGIPPVWIEVFNSNNVQTNIFMVHEILRTMGVEDEKTYGASSSLSVVDLKMRSDEVEQIPNMLGDKTSVPKGAKCIIQLFADGIWNNAFLRRYQRIERTITVANIWADGKFASRHEFENDISKQVELDLINPNRDRNSIAESLISELRLRRCFN